MWHTIHMIALGFPDRPTDDDRRKYKSFFTSMQYVIPCAQCAVHFQANLKRLPLDDAALESRSSLFAWTVHLHNIVNEATGKPTLSVEQSAAYYMNYSPGSGKGSTTTLVVVVALLVAAVPLAFLIRKLSSRRVAAPSQPRPRTG